MSKDTDHNYYQGSTPVNGDTTPITRQKIQNVDATRWEELSTTELHDQRSALQARLSQAQSLGHPQLIQHLERGIQQLDQILMERPGGDMKTHVM